MKTYTILLGSSEIERKVKGTYLDYGSDNGLLYIRDDISRNVAIVGGTFLVMIEPDSDDKKT